MSNYQRPLKVFLCHASADKPKVRALYRYLSRHGIHPWFDEVDLVGGQDWQVEIPNALAISDAIIICLTKNSVDKEGYIQKEIKFALDRALEMPDGRIFLIPVRFEDCEVPFSLSRYQWADLFSPTGHAKMIKALKSRAMHLEKVSLPDETSLEEESQEQVQSKIVQGNQFQNQERSFEPKILLGVIGLMAMILILLFSFNVGLLNTFLSSSLPPGILATLTPDLSTQMPLSDAPTPATFVTDPEGLVAFEQNGDIFTMRPDGSNITQLTFTDADEYYPVWSPDGHQIGYWAEENGTTSFYIMDSNGLNVNKVSGLELDSSVERYDRFSWSPNGNQIVYSDPVNQHLYLFDLRTTRTRALTNTEDWDQEPDWSPDGRSIAFERWEGIDSSAHDGSPLLFKMDTGGSNIRRISDHSYFSGSIFDFFLSPRWSPDSARIVFVAGNYDLYVMDSDGLTITQLTDTPTARENNPTWSTGSEKIAFEFNDVGNFFNPSDSSLSYIYVMDQDGTNPVQLVEGHTPSWQPLP